MPLGTSMDYESSDSRSKGCWDPAPLLTPFVDKWSSTTATPDFVIDEVWTGMVASVGFGGGVSAETVNWWKDALTKVYVGDEGRKKAKMAVICLVTRDGLLLRLRDIKCPVYWLQGSEDGPYGLIVPAEQIKLFTSSKETKLSIIQGGAHYLNATSPVEVGDALLELVTKYA